MPNRRREETVVLRVRLSSHGAARRIADNYSLPSISDAIEAAMRGWDLLTDEQRAEILGEAHDETPREGRELEVDDEEDEENGSFLYYTSLR